MSLTNEQDFYFEVEVIHLQKGHNTLGIGCAPIGFDCSKNQLLGWYQKSCGYHSDDGKLYNNTCSGARSANGSYGSGQMVGSNHRNCQNSCGYRCNNGTVSSQNKSYGVGDIVGCGMSEKYQMVYFTRNGAIEALVPDHKMYYKTDQMHPTISFYSILTTDRECPPIIRIMKESEFIFKSLDVEVNKTDRYNIVKEDVCIFCFTDEPNVVFLPCNHQACCTNCISTASLKVCPICQQKIKWQKNVSGDDATYEYMM